MFSTPADLGRQECLEPCWHWKHLRQIAPTDVASLAAFVKATGWQCLYGINLGGSATGARSPSLAAAQVAYVYHQFGSSLLGIEIGNECELFGKPGKLLRRKLVALQIPHLVESVSKRNPANNTKRCDNRPSRRRKRINLDDPIRPGRHNERHHPPHPAQLPRKRAVPHVNGLIPLDHRLFFRLRSRRSRRRQFPRRRKRHRLHTYRRLRRCRRSGPPRILRNPAVHPCRTGNLYSTQLSTGGINATAYSLKTSTGLNLVLVNKDSTRNLSLSAQLPQSVSTATLLQ